MATLSETPIDAPIWHITSAAETLALQSSSAEGLSAEEAQQRLQRFGCRPRNAEALCWHLQAKPACGTATQFGIILVRTSFHSMRNIVLWLVCITTTTAMVFLC